MILKKAILYVSAVSAIGAAAVVCVIALAFTLYAAVLPAVGSAWAGASVAGAAALLIVIVAVVLIMQAHPPKLGKPVEDRDMLSRMVDLARDKPIVAATAIIAAGAVALKNPKIVATVIAAALATRPATSAKKK